MNSASFIHADIFFFIATIALVLISVAVIIAFVYAIAILKNVREITDKTKAEWSAIVDDSRKLRGVLRDEGLKWKHIAGLIRTFFVRGPIKKMQKTQKTHEEQ